MAKTVHEIDPLFKGRPKSQLMHCAACEARTLHTTPFFGFPFSCAANHGRVSRCDGCDTYVGHVSKVVVDNNGRDKLFCALCCEPDSPEKLRRLEERRRKASEEAAKPVDLSDPTSIARALGASSFGTKK